MRLEKKVLLQAKTINRLQEENSSLRQEVEDLNKQLEHDKQMFDDGCAKVKELLKETAQTKAEYEKLIEELKIIRKDYKNKIELLSKETKNRNKKIDGVLKVVNKFAF